MENPPNAVENPAPSGTPESATDAAAVDQTADSDILDDVAEEGGAEEPGTEGVHRPRARRRHVKADAEELRLCGRRAFCKSIADIAPDMLKTVKLRDWQSVSGLAIIGHMQVLTSTHLSQAA